jgi:hypothetical protein
VYGIAKFDGKFFKVSPHVHHHSLFQWREDFKREARADWPAYQRRVTRVALRIAEGMEHLQTKGYFMYLFMGSVLMGEEDKVQFRSNEGIIHRDSALLPDDKQTPDFIPSGPRCPEYFDESPWTSAGAPRARRTEKLEPRNVWEFSTILNLLLHPDQTHRTVRDQLVAAYKQKHGMEERAREQDYERDRAEARRAGGLLLPMDAMSDAVEIRALKSQFRPPIAPNVDPSIARLLGECWKTEAPDRLGWTAVVNTLRNCVATLGTAAAAASSAPPAAALSSTAVHGSHPSLTTQQQQLNIVTPEQ